MMTRIKSQYLLKFSVCLFLILATLTAFWRVQYNEFINLDDNLYITDNPSIKKGLTLNNLGWAFSKVHAGHWHPLTWLSHMLDVELFGLHPGWHHLINLFCHIINSLLLFLLLQKITGGMWQSAFVASLFALHPLRVESVAWAAERKDVLCAFFFILTIFAYFSYIKKRKFHRYFLVLLFFIMALMSKPMAVTLPFVLLLLDYWPIGRFKTEHRITWHTIRCSIQEKIPLVFLSALISILTYMNHIQSGAIASFDKLPLGLRIGNVCVSYIRYIWKMFWPEALAVLYPHPIHLPLSEVIGAALLLILITLITIWHRRNHPYLIVGWLWYLGTLVPVIGLVQAGIQSMADRFTYIPMIGLNIMVSFGISQSLNGWRFKRVILFPSGISLLFIFALLSSSQIDRWRNSVTLFNHTLNVTQNNYLIHNNLGVTLMRQGNYQEAAIHYRKALEIKPSYADAYHNLGSLFLIQGNEKEALDYFSAALKFGGKRAELHNAIGGILTKQNKTNEALSHFSEAVRIDNNYDEAYYNLGTLLLKQGRIHEAFEHLSQSLKIHTQNAKAHHNLGLALESLGRAEEAIKHYRESLQIDPANPDTHFCLASLLLKQGRDKEALFHFNEATKLNPNDVDAHNRAGELLFRNKRYEEALSHFTEVVRINPIHGQALYALGEIYLITGKKELAIKQYKILENLDKHLANRLYQKISQRRN